MKTYLNDKYKIINESEKINAKKLNKLGNKMPSSLSAYKVLLEAKYKVGILNKDDYKLLLEKAKYKYSKIKSINEDVEDDDIDTIDTIDNFAESGSEKRILLKLDQLLGKDYDIPEIYDASPEDFLTIINQGIVSDFWNNISTTSYAAVQDMHDIIKFIITNLIKIKHILPSQITPAIFNNICKFIADYTLNYKNESDLEPVRSLFINTINKLGFDVQNNILIYDNIKESPYYLGCKYLSQDVLESAKNKKFRKEDNLSEAVNNLTARKMQQLRELRKERAKEKNVSEIDEAKKECSSVGNKQLKGKAYKTYTIDELKDFLKDYKNQLKEKKIECKKCTDDKECKKIDKEITLINDVITNIITELTYRKENKIKESVSDRFSKYSYLLEKEDEDQDDSDLSGLFDNIDDTDAGEKDQEDKDKEEKDADEEEYDDTPMTAIVLIVKKDQVDKAKEEMIDAGIDKKDIEITDDEDDDERSNIIVSADSIIELKKYLDGKGIDLEEKIGGEIVDDSEEDEDKEDDKDKEDEEDFDKSEEDEDFFDDDEK